MAFNTTTRVALLVALLAVSTTFADIKHLKILTQNEQGADCLEEKSGLDQLNAGQISTAADWSLLQDDGSPFKAPGAFGSRLAPFAAYDGGSIVSSSTAAPLLDATFDSSTASAAALIGSSTPAPLLQAAADAEASLQLQQSGMRMAAVGPQQVSLNRSPAYATAYGSSYSAYAPAYEQGVQITKTAEAAVQQVSVAQAPAPHHEITINKEVPVPYYVQIEKRIPYPVVVRIPQPYPVTVEKHVPYAVHMNVDRPVPVPQPYPVEVEKKVPYPVEKPVPYEVRVPVDRPYPVRVAVEKPVPYAVEKPVPYPVRVNVDRPYPVEKRVPYPVAVEKPVPYAVEKRIPYPVEKLVPYAVEKQVPYPVRYDVPVKVAVPYEVKVPVSVDRPVPYAVEKKVPYPVQVPYAVKVPVPVSAPTQRFATVHYYQQSPAIAGAAALYDSSAAFSGQAIGAQAIGAQAIGAQAIGAQAIGYKSAGPTSYYATSTPAPFISNAHQINAFSSTASPIAMTDSSYSTTMGSNSLLGSIESKLSQEGYMNLQKSSEFVRPSAQYGFGQQTAEMFGSSTTEIPC